MRNSLAFLAGLSHRAAYGALAGVVSWVGIVFPFPGEDSFVRLALALDYPVALVGRILPMSLRGIDMFFGGGIGHVDPLTLLASHLRASILIYVALLYVPNAVVFVGRAWMNHRKKATAPRPEAKTA